jgi:hypothetical protein
VFGNKKEKENYLPMRQKQMFYAVREEYLLPEEKLIKVMYSRI